MKVYSTILVSLLVFCFTDAELECEANFHYIASKCYRFHQNSINWQNAEGTCEGDGAKLASVTNEAEYSGLLAHINRNYAGTYWISGAPLNGEWIWTSTGTKMNLDWFGRTPSTDTSKCAYFCSNTHRYWDGNCVDHKRFICEKDFKQSAQGEIDLDSLLRRGQPNL